MPEYRYEVTERAIKLGGGWNVKFYDGEIELGGSVFPADPQSDPRAGMDWWNALSETERTQWMAKAGNSGRAADAWGVFLNDEAHTSAVEAGEDWLSSRGDV